MRKEIIHYKNNKIVDRHCKKEIKKYCNKVFGSKSYWHWLALYTELRGEFKKNWMPTDYYRFKFLPRVNPEKFMKMSDAKTMDHKTFGGYIIQPLLIRLQGQFYSSDLSFLSKNKVNQLLKDLNEEIIIKPESGRQGQGILFEHSNNIDIDELPSGVDLVFQRVVRQYESIDKLYRHSINTFRVLSFINNSGEIVIKYIILRFGIGGSRVDNTNAGGGWLYIHSDATPSMNAYDDLGMNLGLRHPDTEIEFASLKFPYYERIATFCKMAHSSFPYTRLIGWDVYMNDNCEPELIEWNANNPGMYLVEALYGPFFNLQEIL